MGKEKLEMRNDAHRTSHIEQRTTNNEQQTAQRTNTKSQTTKPPYNRNSSYLLKKSSHNPFLITHNHKD